MCEVVMEKQRGQQLKIRFFDDVDHEKLKEIAEMEDRSLTYLVNQAIKQFLKNTGTGKLFLTKQKNETIIENEALQN